MEIMLLSAKSSSTQAVSILNSQETSLHMLKPSVHFI